MQKIYKCDNPSRYPEVGSLIIVVAVCSEENNKDFDFHDLEYVGSTCRVRDVHPCAGYAQLLLERPSRMPRQVWVKAFSYVEGAAVEASPATGTDREKARLTKQNDDDEVVEAPQASGTDYGSEPGQVVLPRMFCACNCGQELLGKFYPTGLEFKTKQGFVVYKARCGPVCGECLLKKDKHGGRLPALLHMNTSYAAGIADPIDDGRTFGGFSSPSYED